jgi:pimeloyl-ACP methyl ester carboxylesterase
MNQLPAGNSLEIDGVRLECRWIGPPADSAPTIVMLHEGLGCLALWRDFPDRLAEATGCGVFVYSRLGYGASDPVPLPRPLTYMEDEVHQVLPKLLDAIGFRRGVLLGHSDGASIAAVYAGSIEDHRVRGLVLYAPHFFVEDISVESIAAAKKAYDGSDLKQRLAKYHGDNVECAFRGWNDAWLAPGFREWNILDCLDHIRVPILIMQGANDEYGTLEQLRAAEQEATCPVEAIVLADCGHAPQSDQPERTIKETARFIGHLMQDHAEAGRFGAD